MSSNRFRLTVGCSNTKVFTSADSKVFVVAAGHSVGDTTWPELIRRMELAMALLQSHLILSKGPDRCGPFDTLAAEISHRGGQEVYSLVFSPSSF